MSSPTVICRTSTGRRPERAVGAGRSVPSSAAGPARPSFAFVMPYHIAEDRGGGAEVQAWLLAKELAKRGHPVSYVAQSVRGRAGCEVMEGVAVRWVRYAHHFRWSNGLAYYRALSAAAPAIVVQRGASFMTGVIALWCRRHGARFAWMCSDDAMPRRWMHWRGQRAALARTPRGPLTAGVLLANALAADLSRHWGMRRLTWAFTQNDEQERLLLEHYGLSSLRMVSGHHPPARLVPAAERHAGRIVLWVANLGPRKRPELFVELARRCAGTPLKFVMIGGRGDEDYLRRLFADKPANLDWLGRLPFDETLAWFDRAAYFVSTSPSEGFANTFIQAWLRGVPVLSLGADPDAVIRTHALGHVATGLEDLADRLQALDASPRLYCTTSDTVRTYALERHTVESAATTLLSAIIDRAFASERQNEPLRALER